MNLAVDPGVKATGLAWFEGKELVHVELVRAASLNEMLREGRRVAESRGKIERIILEKPQVYGTRHQKGDPNDLISVALIAGSIATVGKHIVFVRPRQWKGNVPKHITEVRVRDRLSPKELELLNKIKPKYLAHNAIDAVGIGVAYL